MRNSAGPDDAPDTAPDQHVRPRHVAPLRTANDRAARLGLERPPATAEFHTSPLVQPGREEALDLAAAAGPLEASRDGFVLDDDEGRHRLDPESFEQVGMLLLRDLDDVERSV